MKSCVRMISGRTARRLSFMALAGFAMFSLAACGEKQSDDENAKAPGQDMSQKDMSGATDHDKASMPKGMDMSASNDGDKASMPKGMDMSNMITPEQYAILRDRVPHYKEYTDEQILLEMQMMGGNDWRYLSPEGTTGNTGILVLIHGFGPTGDRVMRDAVKPLGKIFPTAIAAGMSMMGSDHIQAALDKLTEVGAKTIIVVPLVSTEYNSLAYQWDYVFGKRAHGSFLDIPQVKTKAKLLFVKPIEDSPLAAEIILDHAKDLSTDPANELVIIVAHGPHWDKENQENLKILSNLGKTVKQEGGFSDVQVLTLQDDAPMAVRAANVKKLRAMISKADDAGKNVIIVTNLLAARSIQWKIERDLKGLDYKFSVKGISEHPNFAVWLREQVMDTLKSQSQAAN